MTEVVKDVPAPAGNPGCPACGGTGLMTDWDWTNVGRPILIKVPCRCVNRGPMLYSVQIKVNDETGLILDVDSIARVSSAISSTLAVATSGSIISVTIAPSAKPSAPKNVDDDEESNPSDIPTRGKNKRLDLLDEFLKAIGSNRKKFCADLGGYSASSIEHAHGGRFVIWANDIPTQGVKTNGLISKYIDDVVTAEQRQLPQVKTFIDECFPEKNQK